MNKSSKKSIEILIATMNRTSLDFLDDMFPKKRWNNLSILIVNQTCENVLLNSEIPLVRVINSFELGLSKSRNLAILNSIGSILVIADDDVVYEDDFITTIDNAHSENPDAVIIAFSVNNEKGKPFKKYAEKTKYELNYFDIYNIMSIEITLNKDNFDYKNIKFDENFGINEIFLFGEEQIFLADLKKQNHQMIFVPKVIASHYSASSNEKIDFENQYFSLGGVYSRNHGQKYFKWVLLKIFFDLKQSKISFTQIYEALRAGLKGRNQFLSS